MHPLACDLLGNRSRRHVLGDIAGFETRHDEISNAGSFERRHLRGADQRAFLQDEPALAD